MQLGLEGKSAAVAAGSRGIGRATARMLAMEGARVAICGRDAARIDLAARELEAETKTKVIGVVADVGSADDCRSFIAQTARELGGVDILVTNTGGPPPGRFDAVGWTDWEAAFRVTLANVVHLVAAAAPLMRANRWGRIVNIASVSAKQPIDGLVLSNAFRPAILGLAKTLSYELGSDAITVNTVCPGYTRTERLEELADSRAKAGTSRDQVFDDLARNTALGRIADPDEIASVIAFLCSERASYLTGVTLAVDGGAIRGLC
ncbi:MAG: SDR family oxidoreductase [Kofleriaceae bacterium]